MAPHTLFAAVISVLPSLGAQLLGIGNYGTSLRFCPINTTNGAELQAMVQRQSDDQSLLEVGWAQTGVTGTSAAGANEVAQALLDAVALEVEDLPPVDLAAPTSARATVNNRSGA